MAHRRTDLGGRFFAFWPQAENRRYQGPGEQHADRAGELKQASQRDRMVHAWVVFPPAHGSGSPFDGCTRRDFNSYSCL